jgi:hypothetical protein
LRERLEHVHTAKAATKAYATRCATEFTSRTETFTLEADTGRHPRHKYRFAAIHREHGSAFRSVSLEVNRRDGVYLRASPRTGGWGRWY